MGDELRDRKLALRDQIEESLHVAVGGPPYIADRVVLSTREIVGFEDAGPHRAGEQKLKLLAKPSTMFELDCRIAEANYSAAVADQHGGHLDRTEVLGRHGEQHRIYADPAAHAQRVIEGLVRLGTAGRLSTVLHGDRALARVEVHSHHAASIGTAKLHQELPEQPEPDDCHTFT